MSKRTLLLLAGIAAVGAFMALVYVPRSRVRRALRDAAARYGIPPEWMEAIGYVESRWRPDSVNMSGADGARGGSWGPTQISERTARAHGYTGSMEALLSDPELAADLTGQILAASTPANFAEAVAAWNAGRYNADRDQDAELDPGEAPRITVEEYWPRAVAALEMVGGSLEA